MNLISSVIMCLSSLVSGSFRLFKSHRGTLNFLGLDKNQIKAVADNTPLKIGKLTPGTHIPIVTDEEFEKLNVNYALLLTWNYLEFFLNNSTFIKSGGKFIVPFPKPKIFPK